MNEKKGLTLDGLTISHTLFILNSIAIIAITIYLTKHYFDLNFAQGGLNETSTLCNISQFFTCDHATLSKASNLFGVPVAFFGLMVGVSFLLGSFFPNADFENTNKTLATFNLMGCSIFFLYSLFSLGSLCPMCTAYYLTSLFSFILLTRYGLSGWMKFNMKILALLAVITLSGAGILHVHAKDLKVKQVALSKSVIGQYYALPNLGLPDFMSPFYLNKAQEEFTKAPIHISVFSDFQCPFCKNVATQFDELIKKYKGQMNVNYYYYPLDSSCNPQMKSAMHPDACKASYVAICSKDFKVMHDEIFANQETLSIWLAKKIKDEKLESCIADPKTKEIVLQTIKAGDKFKLQSTPTLIVNGVKIEGTIPTIQFINLFDEIIKRSTQK